MNHQERHASDGSYSFSFKRERLLHGEKRDSPREKRERNREAEKGEGERDREIKNCSLQLEDEKMS